VKLYLTHTRELKKHLNIAGNNTFGLRFHNNGMKANSLGSDLFETFGLKQILIILPYLLIGMG